MFEINGNLSEPVYGLKNYALFVEVITKVWTYYEMYFERSTMSRIDLYIDNATEGSGYTPITTPIHEKYLIIKLGVREESDAGVISFQFAHELMHYIFYARYGLNKENADDREESICTAASLIALYHLYPQYFTAHKVYVETLEYKGYRDGAYLAEKLGYNMCRLKALV